MPKLPIPDIQKLTDSFRRIHPFYLSVFGAFVILSGALGYGSWYGYARITELSSQLASLSVYVESLETNLESTTSELKEGIEETQVTLSSELEREKQNIVSVQEQLGSVGQEVGAISGTVGTLEKLSKTDPELLQKYSKVFFLNEHYYPERVTDIPARYLYIERNPEVIHANVWPYLEKLLNAAEANDVTIYVMSAYRSFDEQRALKGIYTVNYGEGTANTFSADQGFSEHQLGTTVDFITTGLGGQLDGFGTTEAYQWLLDNAHRYGFTLSYPENNDHYIFEPWHWRYVGISLATDLKNQGKHFYDLDQRDIDEYLVSIFD